MPSRALWLPLMASAFAVALAACPHPVPSPVPPPDASDASTLDAPRSCSAQDSASICKRLADLPSKEVCPEATVATCAVAFDRAEAVTVTGRSCLACASTAAEARACGSFVTCPQPGGAGDVSAPSNAPAPSSSTRPRFR